MQAGETTPSGEGEPTTTAAAATSGYDARAAEPKWQEAWKASGQFATPDPTEGRADAYLFTACPFTSGDAHMGHVRSYSIADAHARFLRARGDAVLFSIGFDAFGLPSELGAIKNEVTPQEWATQCSARIRTQFERMGFSFDWDRMFVTSEPELYRWTQWLFLTFLEQDLMYRREALVDWCDGCETVLARTQVEDGGCWRCHGPVRPVQRSQWYLRMSAYNEENHQRLEELEGWTKAAVSSQRVLLGRIDGVEFDVKMADGSPLTLFTPYREAIADTAFVGISPNHPSLDLFTAGPGVKEGLAGLRTGGLRRDDRRREEATYVDTGVTLMVPGVSRPVPVIVSPAVEARFGPTAVLGIPSQDATDAALAEHLPTQPAIGWKVEGKKPRPAARYLAADFPVSRQRAWGTPIPLVHCDACGTVPVPKDALPVRLPDDLVLGGEGSPLAQHATFATTDCPQCGAAARRETDTLDGHVDALWRQAILPVPQADRADALFEHPDLRRWLPAAQVVTGSDTGGFALDKRMVAKALRDAGVWDFLEDGEPYGPVLMHEMIQLDGRKMSKHLGNVVAPDELVDRVGADAVRFAVLFAAAPSKPFSWDEQVLTQCIAFLDRLWAFAVPRLEARAGAPLPEHIDTDDRLRRKLAAWCAIAIEKTTENYERLDLHRVTRNVMTLAARLEDFEERAADRHGELTDEDREAVAVALTVLIQLLAPVAPHIAEELWERAGHDGFVGQATWPEAQRFRDSSPRPVA